MADMPDPLTDLPPPSRSDPDDLINFAVNPAEPPPPLIVVSSVLRLSFLLDLTVVSRVEKLGY